MVFKFFPDIKDSEKGITLIELVVVIFVIVLFSVFLISDFPKIIRQYALSRTAYKLAQDLRRAEDMGLSGVHVLDINNDPISVKGYGIYLDINTNDSQYIVYADVDDSHTYAGDGTLCSNEVDGEEDCVVEAVNIKNNNPDLYIKQIRNISGGLTSINFRPPAPIVDIYNRMPNSSEVGIVLGLSSDSSSERTVCANSSGLISVHIHNCSD